MKRIPWQPVLIALMLFAAPAPASTVGSMWAGFRHYWGGVFGSVSGVVGVTLLVGAASLFIITRGKWIK